VERRSLALRCSNERELISHELVDWATQEQITLLFIESGKSVIPTKNADIERFNRTERQD
jgi:putative transposase